MEPLIPKDVDLKSQVMALMLNGSIQWEFGNMIRDWIDQAKKIQDEEGGDIEHILFTRFLNEETIKRDSEPVPEREGKSDQ